MSSSKDALEGAITRLQRVSKVLKEFDSEIRPLAFEFLKPYLAGEVSAADQTLVHPVGNGQSHANLGMHAFFKAHTQKKPADNVSAIAAWYYSQYGLTPLKKTDINETANLVGITVPSRSDKTLAQKTVKGKVCFRSTAGGYVPTVHGEDFMKETYKVTKGRKPLPVDENK